MVELRTQAGCNDYDGLWISYGDKNRSHIIVNGGHDPYGRYLYNIIEYITSRCEKIEAIILTHIAENGLEMIINGIKRISPDILNDVLDAIYINTGRGVVRKLKLVEPKNGYPEDTIFCSKVVNGYSQIDTIGFQELLEEKDLTHILHDYVASGDVLSMPGGASIKIISPGEKELRAFVSDWTDYSVEPHEKRAFYDGRRLFYGENLADIEEWPLEVEMKGNEEGSISFLFEFEDVKIAYMGAADPFVCLKGLKKLGINKTYPVDVIYLPSRGILSKGSEKLLKVLKSDCYVLGSSCIPDKISMAWIAKIARKHGYEKIRFVLSKMLTKQYQVLREDGTFLTPKDKKSNAIELIHTNRGAYDVSPGISIYGDLNIPIWR